MMPSMNEPAGTHVQWAVERLYGDGECRYYSEWFDEAEARKEAEVQNLELLRQPNMSQDETSVVAFRAVSRTVTYTDWS